MYGKRTSNFVCCKVSRPLIVSSKGFESISSSFSPSSSRELLRAETFDNSFFLLIDIFGRVICVR